MRKLIRTVTAFALTAGLCASCAVSPAFAADYSYSTSYSFGSGPDSGSTFGKPTSYDEPIHGDPLATNERRDKNAAYTPPLYGVFSGDIPTNPTSPYFDNSPSGGYLEIRGLNTGDYGGYLPASDGYASTSIGAAGSYGGATANIGGSSALTTAYPDAPSALPSTSASGGYNTTPKYYDDGSMGTLFIPKLNKTIKVFQGETLENMKKGIGHFETTSAWDGNAGFAGHNRGAAPYFSFIKDVNIGDKITYTTPYGARTYEVYRKDKISETDYSGLGWSVDNIISLITCVENQSELRWLVQAKEVR